MARRPRITKKRINDLLAPYSEQFRDAFEAAIQNIKDNAEVGRIVRALQAGNIDEALRALHIDRAVFTPLDLVVNQAYQAGGVQAVAALPALKDPGGAVLVVRFDGRNPPAENFLSQESGNMIRDITQDQLTMARNHMQAALQEGKAPADTALDLVGRLDRSSGMRKGGILGLTDSQAEIIRNAERQLASGSTEDLRAYLARELRDKRFDSTVLRAIKNGTPIPKEARQRMIRSMSNNLLRLRGETISRTEIMKALHSAQHNALQQVQEKGIQPHQIRRIWRTASDARVRDSHASMEGQSVGLNEPFTTGRGASLMYPGDPNGPAREIINCRCDVEIRIDFLANVGR